mgnify:CR=1 FL=1
MAVDNANGEIVGLINNDTEVITPEWLTEMVSHAYRPGVGAVGAKLRYGDGSLQHGGVILGLGGVRAYRDARKFFQGLSRAHFVGAGSSFIVDMIWFPGQGHNILFYA